MAVSISVKGKTAQDGLITLTPIPIGQQGTAELLAKYTLPNAEVDRAGDPNAHVARTFAWVGVEHAAPAPADVQNTLLTTSFPDAGYHDFAVSVRVTYWPGTGEITYAGDATVMLRQVVVQKVWTAGSAIGTVLSANGEPQKDQYDRTIEDGRMTAPQDQRPQPQKPDGTFPQLAKVRAVPGSRLSCAVETATDKDHWVKDYGDTALNQKGDEADTIKSYKWTCNGGQFYLGDNADGTPKFANSAEGQTATWQAPTTAGNYSVICTIDDDAKAIVAPDGPLDTATAKARDDADLVRSVSIDVWQAAIRVKRKDTSDDTYGESTTVAQGAIPNPSHQADVEVTVTDSNGMPITGIAFPNLIIDSGGQGPQPNTVAATVTGFGATNLAGKSFGTFMSGNREETTVIKLPYEHSTAETSEESIASIDQVWNDLPDGNGEGSQWQYEEYFNYDTQTEVTYNIAYNGDAQDTKVDVVGHHLEFVATKMSGAVWNPTAGPDANGDGVPDGDYVQTAFERNNPGFDSPVAAGSPIKRSDLITWSPKIATSATRKYKTNLTIKYNWDYIIDTLDFGAYDNDSFGPEGDTGE